MIVMMNGTYSEMSKCIVKEDWHYVNGKTYYVVYKATSKTAWGAPSDFIEVARYVKKANAIKRYNEIE